MCCRQNKVAANKIKLLKIEKKIPANFPNELLQIKRMLQIKTSKVCARTEGRRSEDFYVFELEAFTLFSWPV